MHLTVVRQAALCFALLLLLGGPALAAPSSPVPPTVVGLTATSVSLAWPSSPGVRYRLYEHVVINRFTSRWTLRREQVSATATLTGLTPGSRHTYAVTAVDATGESLRSAPTRVTLLQAPAILAGTAVLLATEGAAFTLDVNALGNPAPFFLLLDAPPGMTIDTATGIVDWTPRRAEDVTFVVRAENSVGHADHAFTVYVDPAGADREPPSPVSLVQVEDVTAVSVTLRWEASSDNVEVVGYLVLAQKAERGAGLRIVGNFPGSDTTGLVTGLLPATSYRLWVAAYDAAGNQSTISGLTPVGLRTAGF